MTTSTTKSTKSTKTTKTTAPKSTARKSTARSASGTRKVAAQASSAAQSVVDKAAAAAKSFPGLDVSKLDPRKLDLSAVDADKLATAMRDAAYTVVGFGVLAAQKANVRRREMAARIGARFGANSTQVEEAIKAFETRLGKLDDTFQARLDETVGKLGERLPKPAADALTQVHSVATSARKQVRSILLTSAAA